jgi:hypothetical protein
MQVSDLAGVREEMRTKREDNHKLELFRQTKGRGREKLEKMMSREKCGKEKRQLWKSQGLLERRGYCLDWGANRMRLKGPTERR